MANKIYIKRGDTSIVLKINGDLSGSTFKVLCKSSGGVVTQLTAVASSPSGGEITAQTGTLAVGSYKLEVEVTRGADQFTFPNQGYTILVVSADLG